MVELGTAFSHLVSVSWSFGCETRQCHTTAWNASASQDVLIQDVFNVAEVAGATVTTVRPVDTSFTGQNSAQFCNLAKTYNDRFTSVGSAVQVRKAATLMNSAWAMFRNLSTRATSASRASR